MQLPTRRCTHIPAASGVAASPTLEGLILGCSRESDLMTFQAVHRLKGFILRLTPSEEILPHDYDSSKSSAAELDCKYHLYALTFTPGTFQASKCGNSRMSCLSGSWGL